LIEPIISVLDDDSETLLRVLRFLKPTSISLLPALANSVAILGNSAKSASLTLNLEDLRSFVLVKEKLRALMTHAAEDFVDKLNKAPVIDRLGQLNVPEVTRTVFLRYNIESLDITLIKIQILE
jgi:hypothetical protein